MQTQNKTVPNQTNNGISWAAVIILLIVFWPVGIYLLWKKLSNDKRASMNSANILFYTGIVLTVMGLIAVAVGPEDKSMAVTGRIEYFVVFVCGGMAIFLIGLFHKNQAKKFKKYIAIIANQRCTLIDEIAAAYPVSYDTAIKDLQKMIDKGYFSNAYIDANKRQIVKMQSPEDMKYAASAKMVTVVCKSCGANNDKQIGVPGKCEYCGSELD